MLSLTAIQAGHDMVAPIDTEALRRKYAEERDKRLRPDGNDQYLRLTDEFAHYLDDPHTPRTERPPRTDHRTDMNAASTPY